MLKLKFNYWIIFFAFVVVFKANSQQSLIASLTFSNNLNDDIPGPSPNSIGAHYGSGTGNYNFTTDRFGNTNSAIDFNLATVSLHNAADFVLSTYTYSCWVKISEFAYGSNAIFFVGPTNGISFNRPFNGAAPNWSIISNNFENLNYDTSLFSNSATEIEEWHHVVLSRSNLDIKLFIDGKLLIVSKTNLPTNAFYSLLYGNGTVNIPFQSVNIGSQPLNVNSNFFRGIIDGIKIYNYPLTDVEAISLYFQENNCLDAQYTLKSGNWTDTSVWSCGRIPNSRDKIYILNNHQISVDSFEPIVKKIDLGGSLILNNNSILNLN